MSTLQKFLENYKKFNNFTYLKLNHGFWERASEIESIYKHYSLKEQDNLTAPGWASTNFYREVLDLLCQQAKNKDNSFFIGLELSAFPNDNNVYGFPHKPLLSEPYLAKIKKKFIKKNIADGLFFKKACIDGTIDRIFNLISNDKIIIVAPSYIKNITKLKYFSNSIFYSVPSKTAIIHRSKIQKKLISLISNNDNKATVIFACGSSLAVYLTLSARFKFPNVKWIDFGLALSINTPEDVITRFWGQAYRKEIQYTYNKLNNLSNTDSIFYPNKLNLKTNDRELNKTSCFIEDKSFDNKVISKLLNNSKNVNRWANRGPNWYFLKESFEKHFVNINDLVVVPCGNGGIALEILISICEYKNKNKIRWAISSYSFSNLGYGRTSNALILDCGRDGLISIDELNLKKNKFDGFIVTNPFGLYTDFNQYILWAKLNRKFIIFDNAAGLSPHIPNLPYQAFSLHHTKPYGFGEGGLALVPKKEFNLALSFIEYGPNQSEKKQLWINNGKLSETSCAYIIDRLNDFDNWYEKYKMQAVRIDSIAEQCGLKPLAKSYNPSMNRPYLCEHEIDPNTLENDYIALGKYYRPLAKTKNATFIYKRSINIPCHPDISMLNNQEIIKAIKCVISKNTSKKNIQRNYNFQQKKEFFVESLLINILLKIKKIKSIRKFIAKKINDLIN